MLGKDSKSAVEYPVVVINDVVVKTESFKDVKDQS